MPVAGDYAKALEAMTPDAAAARNLQARGGEPGVWGPTFAAADEAERGKFGQWRDALLGLFSKSNWEQYQAPDRRQVISNLLGIMSPMRVAGGPQVLLRGTAGAGHDFSDPNRMGGIFFTKDRAYAEDMARRASKRYGGDPRIDEFIVELGKSAPPGMSLEMAKELGYKSAIFGEKSGKSEFVVFNPNQIQGPR